MVKFFFFLTIYLLDISMILSADVQIAKKDDNNTKEEKKEGNAPIEKNGIWFELWNDNARYETNFSLDSHEHKERHQILSHNSAKLGYRFPIAANIFMDPYFRIDMDHDFANKDWDDYYWINNFRWGPGIRARYEYESEDTTERKPPTFWLDSFHIETFMEYLCMEDSLDGSKDEIDKNADKKNFRLGISTWVSFLSKKYYGRFNLFGEMWSELSYNTHFYSTKGQDNFYILMMQPKIGIACKIFDNISFQPYCKLDLTIDFGSKEWNKTGVTNNYKYGTGLRFSFTNLAGFTGSNIHLYVEWLWIDYFSRVPQNFYKDLADSDCKFGIEIWLPLGATSSSYKKV